MHHIPNKGTSRKGGDFEEQILQTAERYRMLANNKPDFPTIWLEHHEVPKIVKHGRVIYTEKKGFDFVGGIRDFRDGGIMQLLCIEAKTINKTTLPLLGINEKGHGVMRHQLHALYALKRAGAQCFILWRRMNEATKEFEVFRIDPQDAITKAPASIHFENDADILERIPRVGMYWDFLKLLA